MSITEEHQKLHTSIFQVNTNSIMKKGLYEVWFTMFSDVGTGEGYWIRYTLLIPKQDPNDQLKGDGMLWFGYTNKNNPSQNFMIKKKYPISSVLPTDDNHIVKIGDSKLTLTSMEGKFSVDNGSSVSWDLLLSEFQDPYISTPPISKKLGITNNLNFATHPNVKLSGIVTINDREIQINGIRGIQYHTFGDGYKVPWEWFSAFNFPHHKSAYLDFGYKVNKGIMEFYDGTQSVTEWNNSTIKKILASKKIKREFTPTELNFSIKKGKTTITGTISTDKDKLLGVEYRGPLNESFYCYNTSIADLKLKIDLNGRQEEYSVKDSVAFETVHSEPLDGIPYLKWDSENL